MNELELIAGGTYSAPVSAGEFEAENNEYIYAVVPVEDGEISDIVFYDDTVCVEDYSSCVANHLYRFRRPVKAATFAVAVTAYFTTK